MNRGVYRRYSVSQSQEQEPIQFCHEVLFEDRGCLWEVRPSPTDQFGFALVLREESMVKLPNGPQPNSVAELGEVIRIGADGVPDSITVFGNLLIDFETFDFSESNPYPVPENLYRITTKGESPGYGSSPVLCPLNDDVVLYPTPGGRISRINFSTRQVIEIGRFDFPIYLLKLLSPQGPLAIGGKGGKFLLVDVERRDKIDTGRVS